MHLSQNRHQMSLQIFVREKKIKSVMLLDTDRQI